MKSAAFATPLGALTSIVGAQGAYQQLDTAGQAILLPAQTRTAAAYFLNEIKHTDTLRTQLAGRIEQVNIAGTAFTFPSNFLPPPDIPGMAAGQARLPAEERQLRNHQGSSVLLVASLTLQRIERAPRALELFAQGPDGSEKTFKIGNPNLGIETAQTAEIGLKRTAGDFRFTANAYYTSYDKFIFSRATGILCQETFATCGAGTDYIQVNYDQRDATFRGGELAWQWDVAPLANGTFGVDGNLMSFARLHRRQQCAAHSSDAARRRRLLAQRQLVCPRRPAARFRAERRFAVRYDDRRLQSAQGAAGEPAVLEGFAVGRGRGRDRASRRQSAQCRHPQCRSIPQGRDPAARRGFKLFLNVKYGVDRPSGAPGSSFGMARGPAGNMYYKSPPALDAAWNWAGIYAGGNVGYVGGSGCYQRGLQRRCNRPAA